MAAIRHRSTSSPSAWRRASSAAFVAVLAAGLGCGGGAGAPCASSDECAGGLQCRGGVCLPALEEPPDGEWPDAEADDGTPDVEADGGAEIDAEADADDGGADEGFVDAPDGDAAPPPLVTLEPGEIYDPGALDRSGVSGTAGESYVLVLWENGLGIWDRFEVAVTIDNGRKSATARLELGGPPGPAVTPCLPLRIFDPAAVRLPDHPPRILPDPLPGDTTTFKVIDPGGTSVVEVDAELKYIGPWLEIWADTTNPFEDPGAGVWTGIAGWFEGTTLPRERFVFHDEPDVDGNGRVTVLVSPTVGDVGASGYVNPLDLTSSPYGNHKDMIYLNPPGRWGGSEWQVLSASGVLAHELQHLIRAGAIGVDPDESIYLNEGMSHLAADLAGFGYDNLWFLREFLDNAARFSVPRGIDSARMIASTDYSTDVTMRSASYFLLRYLFDRLGGAAYELDGTLRDTGGLSMLRAQFTGDRFGIDVLEWAVGAPRDDFIPDWLTAMLLDGRTDAAGDPIPTPPRHRFADPFSDPVTGAQHGIALNANNAYLDVGAVYLENVNPDDLRDWTDEIDGGGIALLMVRPVVTGPVVAHVDAAEDADVGLRWVRIL